MKLGRGDRRWAFDTDCSSGEHAAPIIFLSGTEYRATTTRCGLGARRPNGRLGTRRRVDGGSARLSIHCRGGLSAHGRIWIEPTLDFPLRHQVHERSLVFDPATAPFLQCIEHLLCWCQHRFVEVLHHEHPGERTRGRPSLRIPRAVRRWSLTSSIRRMSWALRRPKKRSALFRVNRSCRSPRCVPESGEGPVPLLPSHESASTSILPSPRR